MEEVFGVQPLGPIRRIQAIPDAEGKSRVVAILDYLSQTALYPLHLYIFKILKKIPQDCTFDQGSFLDKIRGWEHGVWYSVDLSKATDRFPISLITLVLGGRFSPEYVAAWKKVMVGFPFQTVRGPVQYSVGNPMGAYSSWAGFALAHHFVMYRVSREFRIPWRALPYVVLGDDVLIGDSAVGERYLELIRGLGIEYSPVKSFISDEVAEFAKRVLLVPGLLEVSPFPISAVADHVGDPSRVVAILRGEERKGYHPVSGIPAAVAGLVRSTQTGHQGRGPGSNPALLSRVRAEAFLSDLCTRYLQGSLASGEFLSAICGPTGRDFTNQEGDYFLRSVLVQCATESLVSGPEPFVALTDHWADRIWFATSDSHL